jgi:hypothetical protein
VEALPVLKSSPLWKEVPRLGEGELASTGMLVGSRFSCVWVGVLEFERARGKTMRCLGGVAACRP